MPALQPRPTLAERYQRWLTKHGWSLEGDRRHERLWIADLRRRASEGGFPILGRLLEREEDCHHISLLMFRPEEAVDQVRRLVDESPDPEREVCGLLAQLDWRFHTIAFTAVILGVTTRSALDSVWRAADCGSWAIPQLTVTAYLFDPEFPTRAMERLRLGFPIDSKRMIGLDKYELSSQAGPVGLNLSKVSAKAMASLIYCCEQMPEISDDLRELMDSEAVRTIAATDLETGGQIAARFLESVTSSEYFPGPAAAR